MCLPCPRCLHQLGQYKLPTPSQSLDKNARVFCCPICWGPSARSSVTNAHVQCDILQPIFAPNVAAYNSPKTTLRCSQSVLVQPSLDVHRLSDARFGQADCGCIAIPRPGLRVRPWPTAPRPWPLADAAQGKEHPLTPKQNESKRQQLSSPCNTRNPL